MKANLDSLVLAWFNDNEEELLDIFVSCSEWLSYSVANCDQQFLYDFFEDEEIENNSVEELREVALRWIAENADEIINFDDYDQNK